ncbi:MAG: hypothetical protein JXR78_12470 [Victivallales bacterium]|nr:hypothetical protein [Victivallales bacterium]
MLSKFIGAMTGVMLGAAAFAVPGKNHEFIVPLMEKAPTIDGKFNPEEWKDAAGFDGMVSNLPVALEQRSVRSYIGATEDAFYFAIISELPKVGEIISKVKENSSNIVNDDAAEIFIDPTPGVERGIRYQCLFNSIGSKVYLTAVRGGYPQPASWNGKYEIANSMHDGKWITEVKVPVASIVPDRKTTDGVWSISLCRDWKQPWIFSSAPAGFAGADTRFKFVKGAPAIQFEAHGDFTAKQIHGELSLYNPGSKTAELNVFINTELDAMPEVRLNEKVTIEPGKTVKLPYDARIHAGNCGHFDFTIKISGKDGVHYSRKFNWSAPRPVRWATIEEVILPFDFEFAYYPYKKLLRVRNLFHNYKKPLPAEITYTVSEKASGKVVKSEKVKSTHGLESKFKLPELNGEYIVTLTMNKDEKLNKNFIRKRYDWEHNKLGRSRKVFAPFTDIKIENNTLSTVFRDHRLGSIGLPEQITIKGIDVLAAPITLKLNGKALSAGKLNFTERAADVVGTQSEIKSGNFNAVANARWEYDGCLKYDLTLKSGEIKSLVLEVPLKDKYAPMYHAMGDGLRNTLYDYFKSGEGEVWSAKEVKASYMTKNFCPYIFLGSALRGLSVFAENDKGWSWNRETPNMRVVRNGKQLVLEVNLVNKPIKINKEQTLSFGMLAAPIKPRPDWWRTKSFRLLGTCINWLGGPGSCGNVYPPGRDRFFYEVMTRSNLGTATKEDREEAIKRGLEYYKPFPDYPEQKKRWIAHVKATGILGRLNGANMIFYYNRAVFNALDEYSTFMNDWSLLDFPSREYIPVRNEIKIVPSNSYSDFALHWYKESFNHGRNQGVYWDNWYIRPSYNTEMTDAYHNPDGSITPAAGIWELRNHSKRTFQMMCELGMDPVIFPHITSASILPMLSFATMQLEWEWKRSTGDVQYRFSRPYTQLVSNGELAGLQTKVCNEQGKQARDEWVQRTYAGVCITHELFGWGRGKVWTTLETPVKEEYFKNPKIKTIRYWDEQDTIRVSDKDYAWILHSIPGEKAVLVICSYKESDGKVGFEFDLSKLGIKTDAFCTDFETREPIAWKNGKIELELKKHEVKAIEFSNKKPEARMIETVKKTSKKATRAATTAAVVAMATSAVGMDIAGVSDNLKEHVIYYNSFSEPGKTDVSNVKITKAVLNGEYDKGNGISGGSYIAQGNKRISLTSRDLSLDHNRTASFWFKFDEELKENAEGELFYNSGLSPKHKKWNYISVFFKGGPWRALKDSALVTQMWRFENINGIMKTPTRAFRQEYPTGKWHHFVITSNGKDVTTYLNGKAVSIMNASRVLDNDDNLNQINMIDKWPVPIRVDDLLFFDTVLSENQIKSYYDATSALLMRAGI